jgi:thiol-disulfide isomerase/thioredoxin
MNPLAVVAILLGLVAFATVLGLVWKNRTGRVRSANGQLVSLPEVPLSARATLLQFSTEVCAPCVPTRRVLGAIADSTDGVSHVDLDLTHRPDLAARFNVLQTPTTLILDQTGAIRARIGGAPRPTEVRAALAQILAA